MKPREKCFKSPEHVIIEFDLSIYKYQFLEAHKHLILIIQGLSKNFHGLFTSLQNNKCSGIFPVLQDKISKVLCWQYISFLKNESNLFTSCFFHSISVFQENHQQTKETLSITLSKKLALHVDSNKEVATLISRILALMTALGHPCVYM